MGGGISYIANRHGEANNKYMPNDDASKPSNLLGDHGNVRGLQRSRRLP